MTCKRPPDMAFAISSNKWRLFKVNSTAKFKCLWDDEQMTGPRILRCGADGKWQPDIRNRCMKEKVVSRGKAI